MAAVAEYAATGFSRSSSLSISRSPDTASPIYPERAIRPLPKSRLKAKLSPEQRSTIVYPPDPPPISPTLSFGVQENGTPAQQPRLTNGDSHHHHHHHHHDHEHDHDDLDHDHEHQVHRVHHSHCTCGEDGDSGDDEVEFDHPDYRYATAPIANGTTAKPDSLQRRLLEASGASQKPHPPGSTASSADGYESFENTSNKKKRKIPLSGASSMHQSQLSAGIANIDLGGPHEEGPPGETGVNGVGNHSQQYSANSAHGGSGSGTGISGAGRGRYGRQDGKHRRPLASSTMNSINGSSRAPTRGNDAKNDADAGIENTDGIISQAIKTAAEQGPLTPTGRGRENASLLQSATTTTNNSTTPRTQFTFTCESDSANKMVDQQTQYAAGTPTPARTVPPGAKHPQGTQTSPPLRQPQNATRLPPPPANTAPPAGHQQQPAAPPPKPKPRRNPSKEYALQAAQRKKNQQYQNFHHRPKHDDMWICEFCEYEDIYGAPPYAMIRRYEIKDRQERKKAAEKRRLLEKAKMKGRKNKKGAGKGKNNNANSNTAPAAPAHPQNYDPNLRPPGDDEYYDDEEYDEDGYEPMGPGDQYPQDYYPPPAPAGTSATPAAGGGVRPHV